MVSFKEVVEGVESRHEERVERRQERRDRRHERQDARRVRFGEIVDELELERGEAVLEEVEPNPDQEESDEASEPWAWEGKEMPGRVRERLRNYQEFLARWRDEHHDDYDGNDEEPEEAGDEPVDELDSSGVTEENQNPEDDE
jgi:hypothetical protein